MDDRSLFRYPPDYRVPELKTALDWSAYPGAGGGFQGAVEMCNNNGACRKLEGGVMCPSYRATRNEKDVTRGRANTLRLAISGQLGPDALVVRRDDGHAETLRFLQGLPARMPDRRRHGQDEDRGAGRAGSQARAFAARPAGRAICRIMRISPSRFAPLANWRNNSPLLQKTVRKIYRHQRAARVAACGGATCSSPTPTRSVRPMATKSCCSPTPSTALTSAKISTPRCACCSRAAIGSIFQDPRTAAGRCAADAPFLSAGLVDQARAELDRLVTTYAPFAARGVPIVGLEPSCLLTLRDELLSLRIGSTPQKASARTRCCSRSFWCARPRPAVCNCRSVRWLRQSAGSWPLPSEIVRRVQAGRTGASAGARSARRNHRVQLLRHGRRLRLWRRHLSGVDGNGRTVAAARRCGAPMRAR